MFYNPKLYNIYYIDEMTTYYSHGVSLSEGQRLRLAKAFKNNSAITIRLTNNELNGGDELMLTKLKSRKSKKRCKMELVLILKFQRHR